jgi:hypothetical protein
VAANRSGDGRHGVDSRDRPAGGPSTPRHHLTRHAWRAAAREAGSWRPASCNSDILGAGVPSSYYEIRVSGTLPPEALLDFERLSASVEAVETVLHGPRQDPASSLTCLGPGKPRARPSAPTHEPGRTITRGNNHLLDLRGRTPQSKFRAHQARVLASRLKREGSAEQRGAGVTPEVRKRWPDWLAFRQLAPRIIRSG